MVFKYIVHKNTFNHREDCKLVRKVNTEGTEKDSNQKFASQREYTNKKKYRAIVLSFSQKGIVSQDSNTSLRRFSMSQSVNFVTFVYISLIACQDTRHTEKISSSPCYEMGLPSSHQNTWRICSCSLRYWIPAVEGVCVVVVSLCMLGVWLVECRTWPR